MHVTRVELENIKAYDRAEYNFSRGTTAIVGQNGAGKTTILEAIAWALFDTLEYSKDDFLRRGAKKGHVRVTFETDVDGRQYTVYRDTGNGYYVLDTELNVKLAEGKQHVRPLLNQHLGIEPGTDLKALFRSAIGVPQGLLTADFRETLTERKAKFDRLLKVEEYREGARRLGDTARLIETRKLEVHTRIANAEGQLARYDDTVAEHEAARARVAELGAQIVTLETDIASRARSVAAMDEAERQVNETRARAERLDVESAAAAQRLRDLQVGLDDARRASERQKATEPDFRAHVASLDALRGLETERGERERLRVEASEAARLVAAAEGDARRSDEALERARAARAALAELEKEVGAQEELERERERLRDLSAQARAAGERLTQLERELKDLRAQHKQTSERVRAAEGAEGAPRKVEQLESERLDVETRLSTAEKSAATRAVLAKQREGQAREVERVRRNVAALEREARELERKAAGAERAAELEARERELAQQAARLRAELERDEKICADAENGLCPVLGDKCKSFGEGQTVEGYFAGHVAALRAELKQVEKESKQVVEAVGVARVAAQSAAQLERERARLAGECELFAKHEEGLAGVERELSKHAGATSELLDKLQAEMFGIDGVLKTAREEALRYAELEPLREALQNISEEGKRKKEQREEAAAVANGAAALSQEIKETEERLRALGDPRGRASALRVEAGRVEALQTESERARKLLEDLVDRTRALDVRLEQFKELDAKWTRAEGERERTAQAHREYLESESLAATLPAREAEVREATKRAETAKAEAGKARAEHERAAARYERERHNEERSLLMQSQRDHATVSAQLAAANEREASLASEIARLEAVRASRLDDFRERERLEELYEATDFVRDTLKQAGPLVTESYLYNISIEANQMFREITGEGGRSLRWSKDYDIILEEGGHDRSFANLSGGEQMVAALAVRLALLKQLSDIRVAFFDEPTVNMDEERRQNLARQIGQVRHFDQLFVISHDDTFEESVDHVVTVTREAQEVA